MSPPRRFAALLILLLTTSLFSPGRPGFAEARQELSEPGRWLQAYLRLDTTNPPGREYLGAAYLATILRAEGIPHRLLTTPDGRTSLYARLEADEADREAGALALMHHIDVVPAGPGWDRPPFDGRVDNGVLWGRGAVDAKSLGIAHLAALVALERSGARLKRDVVFLAVADEENGGGRGTAWLLEHHGELLADVEEVLNEGGHNPTVNGRILWWGVEVAQKRPLWLRVSTRGRAGHASGQNPKSATHQLIAALDRLLELPIAHHVSPPAREHLRALAPLHGEPYATYFADIDAILTPEGPTRSLMPGITNLFLDTVQVTVLHGSERINSVAGQASAEIDIRLLPDTDEEAFLARVREALGEKVEVEVLLGFPRIAEQPLRGEVHRALESAFGEGLEVVPVMISGFTDSRFFRQRGIAAYGVSPFGLEPQVMMGIHSADERIPLRALDEGVERMRRLVAACTVVSPR